MGCSSGPDIIEDGLVLCLDAASKRSYPGTGTVWTDLAGSNNGTLTNSPTFSSDNGGAFTFDGTNDYVLLPSNLITGNGPLSLSFVFSADSNSYGADEKLFSYGTDADGGLLSFTVEGTGFRWRHIGGNITYGAGQISVNTVTFVTMVLDSDATTTDNMKCYIDAVEYVGSRTGGSDQTINIGTTDERYIARFRSTAYWSGKVFMFQYYNRALSDEEIRRNYLSTKERYA